MLKVSGKAVYKGIVIGPVLVFGKEDQKIKRTKIIKNISIDCTP